MARFHVKGRIYLNVTTVSIETEIIDDVCEAESEADAQRIMEERAEDSYSSAVEVEIDDSRLVATAIPETEDEILARITEATYRQMRAMHAPTLPGMEVA